MESYRNAEVLGVEASGCITEVMMNTKSAGAVDREFIGKIQKSGKSAKF